MKERRSISKRGQIWVETVIYTLIALVMIGLVFTYVEPKIEELQDKSVIEDSIKVLEEINSVINEIDEGGPGNQRTLKLSVKEGAFKVDGINDAILFEMESKNTYSQPDINVDLGNVIVHTKKLGKINMVNLTINYAEEYNLTFDDQDQLKVINKGGVPYNILISNKGKDSNGNPIIDLDFN